MRRARRRERPISSSSVFVLLQSAKSLQNPSPAHLQGLGHPSGCIISTNRGNAAEGLQQWGRTCRVARSCHRLRVNTSARANQFRMCGCRRRARASGRACIRECAAAVADAFASRSPLGGRNIWRSRQSLRPASSTLAWAGRLSARRAPSRRRHMPARNSSSSRDKASFGPASRASPKVATDAWPRRGQRDVTAVQTLLRRLAVASKGLPGRAVRGLSCKLWAAGRTFAKLLAAGVPARDRRAQDCRALHNAMLPARPPANVPEIAARRLRRGKVPDRFCRSRVGRTRVP